MRLILAILFYILYIPTLILFVLFHGLFSIMEKIAKYNQCIDFHWTFFNTTATSSDWYYYLEESLDELLALRDEINEANNDYLVALDPDDMGKA